MKINGMTKGFITVAAILMLSSSANAAGFSKFLAALRMSPIKQLQQQTADLQAQIDALKIALDGVQTNDPVIVDVNCDAGESINAALSAANPNAPITVNISGACSEQVGLLRDNINLRGATPDASITGLQFGVVSINGANNLTVTDLTLKGGIAGLGVLNNSSVDAVRVNLVDSARGALVIFGAFLNLTDSNVSGNSQGLTVLDSSNVRLLGGSVTNNSVGVNVFANGSITLDDNNALEPSVISGNIGTGVNAFGNGTVRISAVIIENNGGSGIRASTGGSVVGDAVVSVTIRGNRNGIELEEQGSYSQGFPASIVNNLQFGVSCTANTALSPRLAFPNVNGNGIGDYSPDCGVTPIAPAPPVGP